MCAIRPVCFLGAVALALAAGASAADEAADAFKSLHGDELKRVLATPAPSDDVQLAGRLLRATRTADDPPGLLTLLCEKAYELAFKDPSGYPTALAAMRLLASRVPAKKVECLQRIVTVRQRQLGAARGDDKAKAAETLIGAQRDLAQAQEAAGDFEGAAATLRQALSLAGNIRSDLKPAIQAQLTDLVARQQAARQLATLKANLEAEPTDAASRKELVRLYLVEMDDPAEAARFVNESLDGPTRKYVPAAARGIEAAPELACAELGDWYRTLVDLARTVPGKSAVLARAREYYNRFLALHPADDAPRAAVAQALKKVEDNLAAMGLTVKAGRTHRLLIVGLAAAGKHESTPAAIQAIAAMGRKTGAFEAAEAEDAGVFNATFLAKFDAICLVNCNGNLFTDGASKTALLDFVRGGKGLVGIHATAGAFPAWPEFAQMLGATYGGNPLHRASIKVDDPGSPLTAAFGGKGFGVGEELYSFKDPYSRDRLHVLLSVDVENSGPAAMRRGTRPDNDYALSWIKDYGRGRVFYCALGHDTATYSDPVMLAHYLAGIRFAIGDLKADTTPSAKLTLKPARGPVLNQ
jgi:hypothetical protein